jgi:hypothetical protein
VLRSRNGVMGSSAVGHSLGARKKIAAWVAAVCEILRRTEYYEGYYLVNCEGQFAVGGLRRPRRLRRSVLRPYNGKVASGAEVLAELFEHCAARSALRAAPANASCGWSGSGLWG